MIRSIVLDAGPLGMVCHPNPRGDAKLCQAWLQSAVAHGHQIILPEIADYEVRRELLRAGRNKAIAILNNLCVQLNFLAIDSAQMLHAAQLWAHVRNLGLPTAGANSLDADVILAAQALSLNDPNVVVATTNLGHISRFVPAESWENIAVS